MPMDLNIVLNLHYVRIQLAIGEKSLAVTWEEMGVKLGVKL